MRTACKAPLQQVGGFSSQSMLVGKFVRPPGPSKKTLRLYEDEDQERGGAACENGRPDGVTSPALARSA